MWNKIKKHKIIRKYKRKRSENVQNKRKTPTLLNAITTNHFFSSSGLRKRYNTTFSPFPNFCHFILKALYIFFSNFQNSIMTVFTLKDNRKISNNTKIIVSHWKFDITKKALRKINTPFAVFLYFSTVHIFHCFLYH